MRQKKTGFGACVILIAGLLLAGCSGTRIPTPADVLPPKTPPDRKVHVALTPYARVGPTDGYLQTPAGGKFGSSSIRRPTLSEIGVNTAWEVGAKLETFWKRHGVTLEWSRYYINHGSGVLNDDLTSQNMPFPAGTTAMSDSFLSYLGIHYSFLHEVCFGGCERIELRPGFGARWMDVVYKLSGDNGSMADRTYTAWAPNILLDWSWRPHDVGKLRFAGRLSTTFDPVLAEKRRAYVFEVSGRAHYDFNHCWSAFAETGYRHTLLDDTQPELSNRIHTDFGPWIGLGFEAKF